MKLALVAGEASLALFNRQLADAGQAANAAAWSSLIHPDDLPLFQHANDRHFRGESDLIELEYRVRQAESLLGRPVGERRYELETALRILGSLGD